MSDDKTKSGGQDRTRINIHEDYELNDWAKKFGITKEQLIDAVGIAGTDAKKVEDHLKNTK